MAGRPHVLIFLVLLAGVLVGAIRLRADENSPPRVAIEPPAISDEPGDHSSKQVIRQRNAADAIARRYADRIRSLLPEGWSVEVCGKGVHVARNEPVEWYGTINLPATIAKDKEESKRGLKKGGFVQRSKYVLTLRFAARLGEAERKKLQAENDATREELRRLSGQMESIAYHKWTYFPKTPQEKELVDRYEALRDSLHKLPDFNTSDAAVEMDLSIDDTSPFHDVAFYSDEVAGQCRRVRERVVALLDDETSPEHAAAGPDLPWGTPVKGVRVRLRADKTTWSAREVPVVKVDAQNNGEEAFQLIGWMTTHCYAHIDDVTYLGTAAVAGLRPKDTFTAVPVKLTGSPHVAGSFQRFPTSANADEGRLELKPGKHVVRISFRMVPRGAPDGTPYVEVFSNPVQIEIVSAEGDRATGQPRAGDREHEIARLLAPLQRNPWSQWGSGTEVVREFADDKREGFTFYTQPDLTYRISADGKTLTRLQQVEGKSTGQFFDVSDQAGLVPPAYVHRLRKGVPAQLKIDDVEVDCLRFEDTLVEHVAGGVHNTVHREWVLPTHPEIPLRWEKNDNWWRVKSFRRTVEVGDREIACVVVENHMKTAGGYAQETRCLSAEVPGHLVDCVKEIHTEDTDKPLLIHERVVAIRIPGPPDRPENGQADTALPVGNFLPGIGAVPPSANSSWSLLYILEQKLWIDPCCEKRNIGLLSKWGLADPETCPYAWVCNVALQAQGLIACRELDTMGVGYFYSGLSGDLKDFFRSIPLAPELRDLQGVELYYNAAITPWFYLTADLQFVRPGVSANDTAVVLGLRGKIDIERVLRCREAALLKSLSLSPRHLPARCATSHAEFQLKTHIGAGRPVFEAMRRRSMRPGIQDFRRFQAAAGGFEGNRNLRRAHRPPQVT